MVWVVKDMDSEFLHKLMVLLVVAKIDLATEAAVVETLAQCLKQFYLNQHEHSKHVNPDAQSRVLGHSAMHAKQPKSLESLDIALENDRATLFVDTTPVDLENESAHQKSIALH